MTTTRMCFLVTKEELYQPLPVGACTALMQQQTAGHLSDDEHKVPTSNRTGGMHC